MNKYLAGGLAWLEIPPLTNDCVLNEKGEEKREKVVGRARFELAVPAMSRRYPNQARPPAQHVIKKFVAQIYVVDNLSQANYRFA